MKEGRMPSADGEAKPGSLRASEAVPRLRRIGRNEH
jgi:hypothetical protein